MGVDPSMDILISRHTLEVAQMRGASTEEIEEVILTGFPVPAKYERIGKGKVFPFQGEWYGRHYQQNRVEVFYVVEENAIITVTVLVMYGAWE